MSVTTWREARYVPRIVRCPAGRFSLLKMTCLLAAILPAFLLALGWAQQDLGARPITYAIDQTGIWTIRFLLVTLAVTPTRAVCDLPRVVMLRRLLGVTAGCYALGHLALYIYDQDLNPLRVLSEITHRFYLMVGCVALIGVTALTITSTDYWQRTLGRHWRKLHKTIYFIAPLAIFHYFLQSKADISNAVFAAGVFFWLIIWRQTPRQYQTWRSPVLAAGLLAIIATAICEWLWYTLATGISGRRVLLANFTFTHELRPAIWIAIFSVAVMAVALARPLWSRKRVQVRARARALATE